MSTDLVLPEVTILEPGEKTLEELAEIATRQHDLVLGSLGKVIVHAVAAGEALNVAAERFPSHEQWRLWIEENVPMAYVTVNRYRRLATYKDFLPAGYTNGVTAAMGYVKHLPTLERKPRKFDWDEAIRLKEQGLSYREIATLLEVSEASVRYTCDPDARKRYAERRRSNARRTERAHKALNREEVGNAHRKAFKEEGGPLAETYSLIRRALQEAQRAHDRTRNRDRREVLARTLGYLHDAEDEVVLAVKSS